MLDTRCLRLKSRSVLSKLFSACEDCRRSEFRHFEICEKSSLVCNCGLLKCFMSLTQGRRVYPALTCLHGKTLPRLGGLPHPPDWTTRLGGRMISTLFDWIKNSHQFLDQSEVTQKPFTTCLPARVFRGSAPVACIWFEYQLVLCVVLRPLRLTRVIPLFLLLRHSIENRSMEH